MNLEKKNMCHFDVGYTLHLQQNKNPVVNHIFFW